jgi:IS1 family transposase
MNLLLFPPHTNEVQFDEKWSFSGKKEKNCNPEEPDDEDRGDIWDHIAFDPENRLIICVITGKRTAKNTHKIVREFKKRTGGRMMRLITTDMYKPYIGAILTEYGVIINPTSTGKRGRPSKPHYVPKPGLTYAMVKKHLKRGKIVKVETEIIFGTQKDVNDALTKSKVSKKINTAFIERQNGTDRNRNSRKVRKTLCFSKCREEHDAMTYFTLYSYNFCWPIRTLSQQDCLGVRLSQRTPAMSAGLTDHIWSVKEWVSFPAVQCT